MPFSSTPAHNLWAKCPLDGRSWAIASAPDVPRCPLGQPIDSPKIWIRLPRLHSEALVFQGFCSFRTLGPTTRVHQPPAFGERCGRFQVATAKRCRAAHRAKSGVNRSRLSTLGSCPTIQTAPTSTTEGRTSRMISWPSAASTSPISASRSVVTTARPHGRGHGRQSGPSNVTPFTSTYKWSATRVTTTSSRRSSIVASLASKAPSTAARSTPEVARARCASRASST